MVRAVRSILFWTIIYKFRRRFTLIILLLSIVFLSEWIYADVVELLKLTQKVEYLTLILPAKWLIILTNICLSAYLIATMFQKEEIPQEAIKPKILPTKKENEILNEKEKALLTKKLRSKAEILMER